MIVCYLFYYGEQCMMNPFYQHFEKEKKGYEALLKASLKYLALAHYINAWGFGMVAGKLVFLLRIFFFYRWELVFVFLISVCR